MPGIAVVAHAGKSLGGGLSELRQLLAQEGIADPLWYEVTKSRKAPKYARRALAQGAEVIFVWGGDGTVQRCIDAVAGTDAVLAILPAGTANLLAANLEIPADLTEAVRVGLKGDHRRFDTGSLNGEHFAVMAGAGFDARMIKEAGRGRKGRFGRAAYLYAGARNLTAGRVKAVVEVDGNRFFKGRVSCILVGNVAKVLGGIEVFGRAKPDDGLLEFGLVTAKNPVEWARALIGVRSSTVGPAACLYIAALGVNVLNCRNPRVAGRAAGQRVWWQAGPACECVGTAYPAGSRAWLAMRRTLYKPMRKAAPEDTRTSPGKCFATAATGTVEPHGRALV